MLYFLSVRISVIAMGAAFLFFIFNHLKGWILLIAIALIPISITLAYNTPHFKKRFEPSHTENAVLEDVDYRKLHWEAVFMSIKHKLLLGRGTEGDRDDLHSIYNDKKLTAAYEENYNAHNQLLEIGLDFGILGMVIFLLYVWFLIKNAITHNNKLLLLIIIIFALYSITESIFVRHSGIILFSLLTSLLILKKEDEIV
ncbi:hypothetical protein ULMS_03590 [Patiriisocius marinistellae]|uniref:O-antigen ligase-related domain-containing protein n=2 Tax=Patiriisocius marinistellae TaxID=2494560 RepID=A0A5J4FYU6_9FLAO|nr:hypothetical protein ULMS_03590 [Patiriisocius marinistellae]